MSTMIAFGPDDEDFARLSKLSSDELKAELARFLTISVHALVQAAKAIRILEERGEDLSKLRFSMMPYLRRIAHGQMLPEVVIRFVGRRALMSRIAALAIPEQAKLASGERVRLVQVTPDGVTTHRLVDPLVLNHDELEQVFDGDRLRPDDEQAVILDRRRREESQAAPLRVGRHRIDPQRGVYVGGVLFTWAEQDEARKHRA